MIAPQSDAFDLDAVTGIQEDASNFHVDHTQRGRFSLAKADMHPELQEAIRSIAKGKAAAAKAIQNTPGSDGVTRAADGSLAGQMADLQRKDPQGPVPDDSPSATDNPAEPANHLPPAPVPADVQDADTVPVSQIDHTLSSNQPDSEAARAFRQKQQAGVDSGMTPGEDPIGINNYLRNPVSSAPDEDAKRDVIAAELKKHGYPTREVEEPDTHEDLVNGGWLVSNPKERAEVAQHFAEYKADQKSKYLKLHPNATPDDIKAMGFGDVPAGGQSVAPSSGGAPAGKNYSDPMDGGQSRMPTGASSLKMDESAKVKPGKKPANPAKESPTDPNLTEYNDALWDQQAAIDHHAEYIKDLGTKQADLRDAYLGDAQQAKFDHDLKMHEYEVKAQGRMEWIRKHPLDANRYWHDMGTGSKVGNILALMLGGVSQSLTGQPNPAQQILDKTIDRDIKSQMASREDANTAFNQYMQLGHNEQSSYQLARAEAKDVIAGQLQSAADRLAGTNAAANAEMESAKLRKEAVAERQVVSANDWNMKQAKLKGPYEIQQMQLNRDLLRAKIAQLGSTAEAHKSLVASLSGEVADGDPLDRAGAQGVIEHLSNNPQDIPAHTIRFPRVKQNDDGSYTRYETQTRLARHTDKDGKLQAHVDDVDQYLHDIEDYADFVQKNGIIGGGPISTALEKELAARNAAITPEVSRLEGYQRLTDTHKKLIDEMLAEGGLSEGFRGANDPRLKLLKKLGYEELGRIETNHLFKKRRR